MMQIGKANFMQSNWNRNEYEIELYLDRTLLALTTIRTAQ